ncbi:TetR/AcrR family transcriptional regulator [Corynebacterium suedekumii]|nr:TetR/AcrR family transcriptional regulator [Corynebacterium suedekumii]
MSTRRRLSTAERRAVILDAARDAFAAAPYPEVSVPAIAAASGSSQALVFHYFSAKAGLHAAVVADAVSRLHAAQDAAVGQLAPGQPVRDRVRELLIVHLDHVRTDSSLISGPGEPSATRAVRDDARADLVTRLAELLGTTGVARHDWALWGWVGFLDRVARRWHEAGCPEDERWPLIEAALGALEGALGDWRV